MGGSIAISKWLTQDDSPTFLTNYGFIIFFLVFKLIGDVFSFYEDEKQKNNNKIPEVSDKL